MKVYCDACDWKGTRKEVLKAESPFDPMDTIEGCPVCKSVHTMIEACDVDGCFKQLHAAFQLKWQSSTVHDVCGFLMRVDGEKYEPVCWMIRNYYKLEQPEILTPPQSDRCKHDVHGVDCFSCHQSDEGEK